MLELSSNFVVPIEDSVTYHVQNSTSAGLIGVCQKVIGAKLQGSVRHNLQQCDIEATVQALDTPLLKNTSGCRQQSMVHLHHNGSMAVISVE